MKMKMLRFIGSGKVTLALIALISGIYLYGTLGNENPWDRMVALIKGNLFVRVIVFLLFAHFFMKGTLKVLERKARHIPSALVFISLSMIISGIWLSIDYRETERHRMGISDRTDKGLRVLDIKSDIPGAILMIGETDGFKITRAEALIDDNGKRITLRPYPFAKTSSGYAYLNDAGTSPSIALSLDGKRTSLSKLDLLPPDKIDVVRLHGYTIEVSFSPEREFKKGRLNARQYNLQMPGYRVVVKKGNAILFEGTAGDKGLVEGRNFSLRFGPAEKWVELVFVRNRMVLMTYAGFIGLIAGILFYPVELYSNLRAERGSASE